MPRRKRERTYRGVFVTPNGTWVGLDFYAENLHLARAHADHVASHDALHEGLVLKVVRVMPVDSDEFRAGEAGSWFPLDEPRCN